MAKEVLDTLQIKHLEEQVLMIKVIKDEIIDGRGKYWQYDYSQLTNKLDNVIKQMKQMLSDIE